MTLLTLFSGEPRHFALLRTARDLLDRGDYQFTVVAAQTACEVYVEVALSELLRRRPEFGPLGEVIPDLLTSYSLMDGRGRRVFAALTGHRVSDADFWPNYRLHVERRNRVVHRGDPVTRDEAFGSLGAVESLFAYVAEAWTAGVAR